MPPSTSSPTTKSPPKAILFDIGGVCVLSPFRAILDYETAHHIPHGWINYAISRSAPDGAWQRLERGELRAEGKFFEMFRDDLRHEGRWREFHKRRRAGHGAGAGRKTGGGMEAAKDIGKAMGARSAALSSQGAPAVIQEAGVGRKTGGDEGAITVEAAIRANSTSSSTSQAAQDAPLSQQEDEENEQSTPSLPTINAEPLFWAMMTIGQTTDPHIFPAVLALRKSSQFIIGALSNTSLFPSSHPLNTPPRDPDFNIRSHFDVFISSAHAGMRKPEKRIYEYAMEEVRRVWKESGREEKEGALEVGDVLFLDDIGENLRMARVVGWRTIRVRLGDTKEAVWELERETGMRLVREEGRL